jgi:hypothetical protein
LFRGTQKKRFNNADAGLPWLQQLNRQRDYWIVPVVVTEMGLLPAATAAPTLVSALVVALIVKAETLLAF